MKEVALYVQLFDSAALSFLSQSQSEHALDAASLPRVLALKSELEDALNEIGLLFYYSNHPQQKLKRIDWRPRGIRRAARDLLRTAPPKLAVSAEEFSESSQTIAPCGMLHSLHHLATSVSKLWLQCFLTVLEGRRSSVFLKREQRAFD